MLSAHVLSSPSMGRRGGRLGGRPRRPAQAVAVRQRPGGTECAAAGVLAAVPDGGRAGRRRASAGAGAAAAGGASGGGARARTAGAEGGAETSRGLEGSASFGRESQRGRPLEIG